MRRFVIVLSAVLCCTAFLSSNPSSLTPIQAIKTSEQIYIDGQLTESIWQRAGFTDFKQREPNQGEPGSEKSEVWLAYDEEAIYVAAKLYDSRADSIVARLVRRDFVYGDPSDGFLVYLDPYHDKMTGNLFYVSAAGTKADGLVENDGRFELSWDAVWEGVAQLHPDGYVVEMKIPFSQLRFKEGDKQVWGINFERYIGRKNETAMVVYTPRNENGFVSRFPDLFGLEGITPPSRLEALPYVTGKAEYIGNNPSDPFNPGEKYLPGAGLDMKVGLGTSLTLDATINPDFGQVEVDPAVVNLSDVETSFQEKRPFFTEGVSIFRFGRGGTNNNWNFNFNEPTLFYSRRIGRTPQRPQFSMPYFDYADIPNGTRILGAGKISGRIGDDWKIGMVHAFTNKELADIDSAGRRSHVEMEPQTYYGIFRAQRDFDRGQQGIGLLATYSDRIFSDNILQDYINDNALVTAVDGWTFFDQERTYVLTGWAGLSHVNGNQKRMIALQRSPGHYFQRPDVDYISVDSSRTSLTGYAGRLMLNKQRGRWTLNSAVSVIDPYFESNDLGFMSFADIINSHIVTGYRWSDPTEYYRQMGVDVATFANYDFGGNKTAHGYWFGGYLTLLNYYGGQIRMQYNPESFSARRTRGGPLTLNPVSRSFNVNLYSDNRNWWVAYAGGGGNSGESGNGWFSYIETELKLTPTFTLTVGPELSRDFIKAQYIQSIADPAASTTFGRHYVFANIDQTTVAATIRLNWILTPELSFQIYAQPYFASGIYSNYKELLSPKSFDFLTYGEGISTKTPITTPTGEVVGFNVDTDGSGSAATFPVYKQDFNYRSLRGNAVLRWEYMPGSALFLVWTQSREDFETAGDFQFGRSLDRIAATKPDNIFLLKVSYWLGM
ncbi:MAG: carbohydrate binding family 9 domain-containing protein [Ignavibacteriales bacterium]|nr:carbohydrate binding family 9 domain-containing protein [Ignavibacteriales bacterium]